MKKLCLFVQLFLLFVISASSQEISSPYADSLFTGKKEVYFKFNISSRQEIATITRVVSISNVTQNNEVFAYANKKEFVKFLQMGYSYTLLVSPGELNTNPLMYDVGQKQINAWNAYPTYAAYEAMMYQFATDYPALCQIYNIKTLGSGRKLLVAKISHNVTSDENEPQFLYSSTIHGNETSGFIHMLHLIDTLLSSYGTNTRITTLLNNSEIWINPLANPDGTYNASGGSSISGAIRGNINGVDMNRNYPDILDGPHPDGEVWQPETEAFMGFADTMNFVMAANFHEGAEVCNYPWDSWTSAQNTHADDNWWQLVSNQFADSAQTFGPSGYFTDVTSTGVTEGGDWYVITGGRQDYMNYFHHCREETIEISSTQSPSGSSLPAMWNGLRKGLLNYMEQSLKGIRGLVTDSCTGLGIRANIFISGHDVDSSDVYSALPLGNYHRPIYTGTYNLTFSAQGYQSRTINNISVTNGNTVVRNVKLKPIAPAASFIADITSVCNDTIQFTDLSGGVDSWLWDFGDGSTSTLQNPAHYYTSSGTYTVSLTVTNCAGSDQATISNYITITKPDDPIVTNGYSCVPASLNLSVSGSGTLNWYDAETGGTLINTGTNYTTPFLSTTTTYYVQAVNASTVQSAGKPDNSGGGANNTGSSNYIIFDSYAPITLISVVVYPSTSGNRTIELRNSSGTVLQTATVNLTTASPQTVSLNFSVPVGTNLQLGLLTGSTVNLFRNNAGVVYPYTTPGLVSVTGSSAGSAYYYFFYNWQIQGEGCASNIVPIVAAIDNQMPVASFTYALNGTSCDFTNTSLNGATYSWDFGDGDSSTDENPSHDYGSNGTFTAQLIVVNGCGSDTITQQITVTSVDMYESKSSLQVSVFPNPADGLIHVSINSGKINKIEISDITGKVIFNIPENKIKSGSVITLDLSGYTNGIYILKLTDEYQSYYSKIILK
jgi:PKD repeat protein